MMDSKKVGTTICTAFFLGASAFIAIACTMIHQQEDVLQRYVPVKAVVQYIGKDAQAGLWRPSVKYTYAFAGRTYTCERFEIFASLLSNPDWASGLLRQLYHEHGTYTAFCDPSNPGDAVLHRICEFFPYATILFVMPHLLIGCVVPFMFLAEEFYRKFGVYLLGAAHIAWFAVGIALFLHYDSVCAHHHTSLSNLAFTIYFAAGALSAAIIGSMYIYAWTQRGKTNAAMDAWFRETTKDP